MRKERKKLFYINGKKKKKIEVAILTLDKIDFKTKTLKKDKEGYCIMIKRPNQQEDMTFDNIYAPNREALKYIRQILTEIKGDSDSDAIIVGDFNTIFI